MKLPDISNKIKRLASLDMPVEALKALFLDLAVELDLEEARLSKDRGRKPLEFPRGSLEFPAGTADIPASRVIDNLPSCLTSGKKEESKPPLSAPPSKPLEPPGFAEWFAIYPKRAGGADRKTAAKAFGAALKRTTFQNLMDGARRYSAFCDANGNTGTQFVLKARKWLNDHGWENTYETTGNHKPNSIAGGFDIIDRAIAERFGSSETDTEDLPRLLKIAS